MGGCLGVCATLWALSKTSFLLVVKPSSAGVYLLMVSIALLFLSGVLGFVGVLKHNSPVIGSVSCQSIYEHGLHSYAYLSLTFFSLLIVYCAGIYFFDYLTSWKHLDLHYCYSDRRIAFTANRSYCTQRLWEGPQQNSYSWHCSAISNNNLTMYASFTSIDWFGTL